MIVHKAAAAPRVLQRRRRSPSVRADHVQAVAARVPLPGPVTMEDWRQCAMWLISCNVLPANHRVTADAAQVFDLAQTLRDGVLLCQLLNNLRPHTINLKEIHLRPQMSQVEQPLSTGAFQPPFNFKCSPKKEPQKCCKKCWSSTVFGGFQRHSTPGFGRIRVPKH